YRAYYLESLRLADASLKKLEGKEVSTALLLAGQAAVFLGDYKLAEERFNRLIYEHSGTEPAAEGLFRLGLVYLRQKKFTLAVAVFERLLALPQIDKWDLASRYWLWRSLEQMKSDRVKSEAEKLVTRFPLTYYGLRARAESNDNKLVFDGGANAAVKVELWLTEPENQAWERFQILLRAGWLMEAQAELEELPSPHSPEEKIVRAKLRSLAFDHFGAIRLVNEAWEENPELLKPALFGLSFPFEFVSLVNKYSKVQGLNSSLVMGLIKQESSFRPEVMSSSRAAGLMQIVSITARDSAQYLKYKKKLSFPEDLFDPDLNIQFGSSYLRRMVRAFDGHLPLALASYNLGIGRLRKWLSYREELGDLSSKTSKDPFEDLWIDELPWAETCFYVKAVLRNFLVYSILKGEKVELSGPFWAKAIK
ncbi:MAG: transglycosylase SLT domain-containing protein, partial [Bdellovibrionales bacterium]|nr:transglycosylase SLT domain-containing protein [Bdellovibrionales bacterium]